MKLHVKPIMPNGFKCCSKNCGIKRKGHDLSVFVSEKAANAAGVFTQNKFPGAPVVVGREIIKKGVLQAIVVNSKISNVATGEKGIMDAWKMGELTAIELKLPVESVIMSSTGIIGKELPIDLIEAGLKGISGNLTDNPEIGAEGIMTTDTYPKALSLSVGDATVTVVGKGSGMIEPNMATMLVYIFTDAKIESQKLDLMLRNSVDKSFNMLSIDTDTSTSDTCLIMANGITGSVDENDFSKALDFACIEMAKMLARDGEGATKLLQTEVTSAKNDKDAKYIAKSVINSPLIKTMVYGGDPNIGRLLMAIGKCFSCTIDTERVNISINGRNIYKNSKKYNFDEREVRELLRSDPVVISIDLGIGEARAVAYGCDLTEGYVHENAAYYSS